MKSLSLLAAGLALSLTLAAPAFAQDEAARANARTAANAGAKAFDEGDWKKAIDYFERAESQFHSPVHLFYIAQAAEKDGQLVRAKESCLKVQREGAPEGASPGVVAAVEGCEKIFSDLEGRIPTLTVSVEGAAEGETVTVELDGAAMPPAMLGLPAPVDPGKHQLSARTETMIADPVEVELSEGGSEELTLTLKPAPNEAPAAATSETGADEKKSALLHPVRWPTYVALGVGVAGLAVGTIFGIDSMNAASEAEDLCGGDRTQCRLDEGSDAANEVIDLNDQTRSSQTLAIVGYGVGGGGLATALVLHLLDVGGPKENASARSGLRVRPEFGFGHVALRGTF